MAMSIIAIDASRDHNVRLWFAASKSDGLFRSDGPTLRQYAIERLVFLAKIDAGLAELDAGQGIPHDEAKRRLGL